MTLKAAEHHVHGSAFWQAEPILLAEHAREARHDGQCSLCKLPVRGQRVADLPGGGVAHLACIAAVA
jgi:hypothetical protein